MLEMQRRDLGFGDDVQRLMLVSLTAPGKACRREVAEVPDGRCSTQKLL